MIVFTLRTLILPVRVVRLGGVFADVTARRREAENDDGCDRCKAHVTEPTTAPAARKPKPYEVLTIPASTTFAQPIFTLSPTL